MSNRYWCICLHTIRVFDSALDATKVENTCRQIANELFHACGDDGATLAQCLADALVMLAGHFNGGGDPTGNAKPMRPTLVVICSEDSLRGRLDNAGLGYTLDGQPVPAAELRRLACNADICPAVMGGAGQILDFGRNRGRHTATEIPTRKLRKPGTRPVDQ